MVSLRTGKITVRFVLSKCGGFEKFLFTKFNISKAIVKITVILHSVTLRLVHIH